MLSSTYKFIGLPADAGNISCLVKSKIKFKANKLHKTIPIGKGLYKVTLKCKNSYNGKVQLTGFIRIDNDYDTLIIGDKCYSIKEKYWSQFLDDTDYGADMHGLGVCLCTGGDGSFDIEVIIKLITKEPKNTYKSRLAAAKLFVKTKLKKVKTAKGVDKLGKEFHNKFCVKSSYSGKLEDLQGEISSHKHRLIMRRLDKLEKELV